MDADLRGFWRHRASISALQLSLIAVAPQVWAQADPEPAEAAGETVIEEVVVTGSRIVRRDNFAPSPIITLDRAGIDISAQPTLEEALKRLPQVTPDAGRTTNNGGVGKSFVSLRNFGANRTLAMLNGRRMAPAGIGSSVDLNSLPQALVQNVEIITGGASTTYGSDAVAGVVNFITRKDFDGLEFASSIYVTGEGDSEIYDFDFAWGKNFSDDRGNFVIFGGYLDREGTFAGARDFTSVQLADVGIGRLVESGSFSIPQGIVFFPQVDLGNGPVTIMFAPDGTPVEFVFPDDLYNFQPTNYLQVPLTRKYGGLFATFDFSDRAGVYLELTHTNNVGQTSLAPVPAFLGRLEVNLDNPVLAPETRQLFADQFPVLGPNIIGMDFARRIEEMGPRFRETHNDYSRLAAGIRGDINDRWDYDLWITLTRGDEDNLQINNASESRFRQGMLVDAVSGNCFDNSGGCVPLDPFGPGRLSPDALNFLRLAPFSNVTSRDQKLVSGFVRGTPFDTWAGPAQLVAGAEWRSDSGDFNAAGILSTGDVLAAAGNASVDGEERVREIYLELLLPLLSDRPLARSLSVEAGGRLSDYDHAGSIDTWKLGSAWEPFESLRVRGMYQRSVRAPNLVEAFQQTFVSQGTFFDGTIPDPCSASADPDGNGNVEKCIIQGIPRDQIGMFEATPFFPTEFIGGGNTGLTPETAESTTIGFVYSHGRRWSLSVDAFDISIDNTIGRTNVPRLCFDPQNTEHVLCDRISRDPVTFNVFEVDGRLANLGEIRNKGIDFQFDISAPLPAGWALLSDAADLDVNLVLTHMRSATFQRTPAVDKLECVGVFGAPCNIFIGETFPENRLTANLRYSSGPLGAQLGWRWIQGTDAGPARYPDRVGVTWDPLIKAVGSKSYFDLSLSYDFGEHFGARLNVANLFDTDPPLMADSVFSNNTDHGFYDIFGRSFQLTLSYHR